MKTLTIIPSRLSATRLPGKPLLKINGLSIISHVFRKAKEANIGEVVVATEDQEIVDDVIKNGGKAIITSNNHKTGTDRIYEAFKKLDIRDVDLIMNLQGDEPAINIDDIISLNKKMTVYPSQMGTLAANIKNDNDLENENIVKVITKNNLKDGVFSRAENFLRNSSKKDNIYTYPLLLLARGIPLLKSSIKSILEGCVEFPEPPKGESRYWSHPTLWEYLGHWITKGVK